MKSKVLFFLCGAIAGALLVYPVAQRQKSSPPPPATAVTEQPAEAEELRASLKTVRTQLRESEAQKDQLVTKLNELRKSALPTVAPETPVAQVSPTNAPEASPLSAFANLFGKGNGESNGMASAMGKFMKAAMQQRIDSRVAGLKVKANLNADQEKAVRNIMEKELGSQQELAMKALSGKLNTNDTAVVESARFNARDEIRKVLTADQWTGFEQFEKEERSNMARLVANSELLQMQQVIPLSQEKQDLVFSALVKQSEAQLGGGNDPAGQARAANWQQQFEAKKDAMRAILSPEEFQAYEKHLDSQQAMIKSFLPNMNQAAPQPPAAPVLEAK